jgi:hypothetical protein
MREESTRTAANAKKKKYVIGGIGPEPRSDKACRISQIIPIENRIVKICANTIPNGGQYVPDIYLVLLIKDYLCSLHEHRVRKRSLT